MRKIGCAVLLAAIVLSGADLGTAVKAMTAAPSLPRAFAVLKIRNVCGTNGCAPVFVKRYQVPPRNIANTVTPLVVSATPAPVQAQPSLPSLPSLSSLPAMPWPLSLLQGK